MVVRRLGLQDYIPIWKSMAYIAGNPSTRHKDEIWILSHKPVFTLGQAGKREHVLDPGDIPVVKVDRGGQVTYHGPGQLVIYLLLDVRKRGFGVRRLVQLIEAAIIASLADWGIDAVTRSGAPGVYVGDAKIAALGLRIRNGCSYHGLSLNVQMDLSPFKRINPCGYAGLAVTQVADLTSVGDRLMQRLSGNLVNALLVRLDCESLNFDDNQAEMNS
ncbi:MAG: lipoyl(octanoyl) transferase LipB [Pseudohongiellaceae bacterium]